MSELGVRDVAGLLRLMRLDKVEELGRRASQFPVFDQAVTTLAMQRHETPTERQKGLATVQLFADIIHAMAPAPNTDNYVAYRIYHLLEAFYLRRQTRRQTLQIVRLGGGSFDRLKAQALLKFLDALSASCARLQHASSLVLSPLEASGTGQAFLLSPTPFSKCHNVPHQPYRLLLGRAAEVHDLANRINDHQGPLIVAISGMGGMGKTALAHAVLRQVCDSEAFADVLWAEARPHGEADFPFFRRQAEPLTVPVVLEQLKAQASVLSQKHNLSADPLRAHRYLVVVDGLDHSDNEVQFVLQLLDYLGPSTLLVTTRHRYLEELPIAYAVRLMGFSQEATVDFLRQEAHYHHLSQLANADASVLHLVHKVTDGLPLALNMVLAKFRTWSLDRILSDLRTASGGSEDFYEYLLYRDWHALGNAGRALLLHFAATSVSQQAPSLIRFSASDLTANARLMETLVRLGLIESHQALKASDHYYHIPPLIRNFLLSNLPMKWSHQTASG